MTDNRPLVADLTMDAIDIKARYQIGWYDSIIVASAPGSDCSILYPEDLNHGLVVEKKLTIINPFL